MEDDRVAELITLGTRGIASIKRKKLLAITGEEMRLTLAKMKGGKAPGMDRVMTSS